MFDGGLSIICPACRESTNSVSSNIEYLLKLGEKISSDVEIIIVDDSGSGRYQDIQGSRNNVIVIENEKNMGKGYSVERGVEHATRAYIFYTDCDLPISVEDFIGAVSNSGVPFDTTLFSGDRTHRSSKIYRQANRSLPRIATSSIFRYFVRLIFRGRRYDTQCPAKLFHRKLADDLFGKLFIKDYAFDVEVLLNAVSRQIPICSVPVIYKDGRAEMSWWKAAAHTLKMIVDVLRLLRTVRPSVTFQAT